jgi:hypothetical protein
MDFTRAHIQGDDCARLEERSSVTSRPGFTEEIADTVRPHRRPRDGRNLLLGGRRRLGVLYVESPAGPATTSSWQFSEVVPNQRVQV